MKRIHRINFLDLKPGIHKYWFNITKDALGDDISVPIIINKSKKDGPIFFINSLLHGDELNGMEVIHKVMDFISDKLLCGCVVAIPVFNVPGFLQAQRYFSNGVDLNSIMPGKKDGKIHQIYAHKIMKNLISKADYLLDLHTARKGSRNCYYVRANLNDEKLNEIAKILNSNLILDSVPTITTLRGSCEAIGIKSITLEIGDPLKYQKGMINTCSRGIINTLSYLGMINEKVELFDKKLIICNNSYRIQSPEGGIVEIIPNILDKVNQGDLVAIIKDVFGEITHKIECPNSGIIIGKVNNPVVEEGLNLIHIGIPNKNK
jgi:predicted deacylase